MTKGIYCFSELGLVANGLSQYFIGSNYHLAGSSKIFNPLEDNLNDAKGVVVAGSIEAVNMSKGIRRLYPKLPILAMGFDEQIAPPRIFKEVGASAYIPLSQSARGAILTRLDMIIDEGLLVFPQYDSVNPLDVLSTREREVYNLISEGKDTKEIGVLLHVSVKTIDSHVDHIKKKMNVPSLHQLRIISMGSSAIADKLS
jgi:DNA-binding NarL/FixJ family response regulator